MNTKNPLGRDMEGKVRREVGREKTRDLEMLGGKWGRLKGRKRFLFLWKESE